MMIVLQSLLKKLMGSKNMQMLYQDIVEKNTKTFIFKVQQLADGTYQVIQQNLRRFPDGKSVVQSEKTWSYTSLSDLREGEYRSSRQGKLFLDDQFWIGKTI